MIELPESWATAPLSAISSDVSQRVPDAAETFTYIDIGSVDRDTKTITTPQVLLGKDAPSRARKQVAKGDTLVSMTRPNLNAVAMVQPSLDVQIASTGFDVLRSLDGVDPRWLAYLVRTEQFVSAMSELVQGALYPAVRNKDVRAYVAPIAPSEEQIRIADQLDTLLARINACNHRLYAITALLKRFRQAVVSAATSGMLTEDFRVMKGAPRSWHSVPLGQLGELGRGKSKHRPRNDPRLYGGDIPFIQTGDVAQSDGWIRTHSQTYSEFGLQQSKLWPAGTVCITIAANIADTAVLSYPACFPDSVVGFIADPSKCDGRFIKWTIDAMKDDLESFAPATAQKNINLAVLNDVVVRLPSLDEQAEIVHRVEAMFRLADRIEARYTAASAQAQRLTPLVLAKAFRGELLPQDPSDEPASVLLARLAAQRASATLVPKIRKPRAPRAARAPNESAAMTKSRQDDDVKDKPYLAGHLRRLGEPVAAPVLFRASELPVADFYKQLAWEVAQGLIKDNTTTLEPGHAAG